MPGDSVTQALERAARLSRRAAELDAAGEEAEFIATPQEQSDVPRTLHEPLS